MGYQPSWSLHLVEKDRQAIHTINKFYSTIEGGWYNTVEERDTAGKRGS